MVKEPIVRVDLSGFLFVDGVKVCRVDRASGTLEFADKDRRRSSARGGRIVRVSVSQFQSALCCNGDPKAGRP